VLAYLRRHPNAEDTLKGITKWWLLEQRIHESAMEVKAALTLLVKRKCIVRYRRANGEICYRIRRVEQA
jgi:hypothetical protein